MSFKEHPPFFFYRRNDREERVPTSGDFFGSINKYIHRPPSVPKKGTNPFTPFEWRIGRFHFDKEIEIASRMFIAPRITSEKNNAKRMKCLDDTLGDFPYKAFIN